MIKDQYKFSMDVDGSVIVIAKFWRSDAEPGKHGLSAQVYVSRESPVSFGELPLLPCPAALHPNKTPGAVGSEFN